MKITKIPDTGRGLMRQNTLFVTFQIRARRHPDRVGVENDDGDACTGFSCWGVFYDGKRIASRAGKQIEHVADVSQTSHTQADSRKVDSDVPRVKYRIRIHIGKKETSMILIMALLAVVAILIAITVYDHYKSK